MATTPASFIRKLRQRVGDTDVSSELWTDDQLGEWIEAGMAEYTYGNRGISEATDDDTTQALNLAFSSAMYELASNTALFFKWKDQQKEIDKSFTPEMCRRIGKDVWERVIAHRKAKDENIGEKGEETNKAQGGISQFTPGDRTTPRTWY